jgi:RHS repeat-associated protein
LQTGKGYCANLGHQEDETGLVYMRARYYEPTTGRFISEDPARDGVNWYLYADGNPVNRVDSSGRSQESDRLMYYGGLLKLLGIFLMNGGFAFEVACFPQAILNIIELADEYQAAMRLTELLGTGKSPSTLQSLRDQIEFLKNAFLYKKNFNGVRGVVGSVMTAMVGYRLLLQGELMQTEAAFME